MVIRVKFLCIALLFSISIIAQKITFNWENDRVRSISLELNDSSIFCQDVTLALKGAGSTVLTYCSISDNAVNIKPAVPFAFDLMYEVRIQDTLLDSFSIPSKGKNPSIDHIFPLSDTLPENFLKFYVVFNQKMSPVNPYENIKLFFNSYEVPNAILHNSPALWDKNYETLTIWIDPGRIKTGLLRSDKLGAVLNKGNIYRLVVHNNLKNEFGKTLIKEYQKEFRVTSRDSLKPNIASAKLEVPTLESTQPLVIKFTEPMDYLSTLGGTSITKDDNSPVSGSLDFQNDSTLIFIPSKSWERGNYIIQFNEKIEDLAGNNLIRLFDQPIDSQVDSNLELHKNFRIK